MHCERSGENNLFGPTVHLATFSVYTVLISWDQRPGPNLPFIELNKAFLLPLPGKPVKHDLRKPISQPRINQVTIVKEENCHSDSLKNSFCNIFYQFAVLWRKNKNYNLNRRKISPRIWKKLWVHGCSSLAELYLDINYPFSRLLSEFTLSGSLLHLICSSWW